jgi:hypothetical protein
VILNLILRMPITKKIAGIDVTQFGEVVAAVLFILLFLSLYFQLLHFIIISSFPFMLSCIL